MHIKKFLTGLLLLTLPLLLPACTSEKTVNITVGSTASLIETLPQEPTTELVLPKFLTDLTGIDLLSQAQGLGLTNITLREDGSYLCTLTEKEKALVLATLKDTMEDYWSELAQDWSFVQTIELNEALDHVTIFAQQGSYQKERDQKIAAAIYAPLVLYRVFSQLPTEESFSLRFSVIETETLRDLGRFTYCPLDPVPSPSPSSSPSPEPDTEPDTE